MDGMEFRAEPDGSAEDAYERLSRPPFEEAVTQLESVVKDLESGDISLEAALARFEEGVRLSRYCLGVLDSAQARIERLVGELNGEPVLEPAEREFE
jgi:exodeoxyribonuclease VII small subunit